MRRPLPLAMFIKGILASILLNWQIWTPKSPRKKGKEDQTGGIDHMNFENIKRKSLKNKIIIIYDW